MPKFSIFLHATQVVLLSEKGKRTVGGAYTWRAVEAIDRNHAVDLARQKLFGDQIFQEEVWNATPDSIVVTAEEIEELEDDADLESSDTGCVFYVDDEES